MKRIYLFTLLLCAFSSGIIAQKKEFFKDNKHELRLSYGSVNDDSYYDQFYYMQSYGYYSGGGYYPGYGGYYDSDYLGAATYSGATKTTGVFGANYFYNMSDLRFSFGGALSYSGYNTDFYNRLDDSKAGYKKGHNIAFTPMIRYSWLSREKFRLYSGIGWSFYWDITRYKMDSKSGSSKNNNTSFGSELMLTPIGFSFGKKVFVFGEVNLGGRTGNFVGGVGYRF